MGLEVKNWNDPSYRTRQDINLGAVAAGSGGVTSKFVAFANMTLFGLYATLQTLGTSTYTGTVSSQQLNVITVINTSTATNSVALQTTTYGPYTVGGNFAGGGTGTAQIGGFNYYQLNTNTGSAGWGGIPLPQGATVYVVSGTDATAVSVATIDYQLGRVGLIQ